MLSHNTLLTSLFALQELELKLLGMAADVSHGNPVLVSITNQVNDVRDAIYDVKSRIGEYGMSFDLNELEALYTGDKGLIGAVRYYRQHFGGCELSVAKATVEEIALRKGWQRAKAK